MARAKRVIIVRHVTVNAQIRMHLRGQSGIAMRTQHVLSHV